MSALDQSYTSQAETLQRRLNPALSVLQTYFRISLQPIFSTFSNFFKKKNIYRTRAIITRGLYTFYPLFEVHLCTVTFGLMYG